MVNYPEIPYVHCIELYFFKDFLFAIPHAVLLSMWIGVGGCGWPRFCSVRPMVMAVYALRCIPPSSASAGDPHTTSSILHNMWMWPFNKIGGLGSGLELRKKNPPAVMHAFGSERYDALECVCKIIWLTL